MDKKKIKRIIAREGLCFLGIIVTGIILIALGSYLNSRPVDLLAKLPRTHNDFDAIVNIGIRISIFGYPLYLLIRFIVWTVRTLGEKERASGTSAESKSKTDREEMKQGTDRPPIVFKKISLWKFILFSFLLTACLIIVEIMTYFSFSKLLYKINVVQRLILASAFFGSIGVFTAIFLYRLKKAYLLFLISGIGLLIFRWIFCIFSLESTLGFELFSSAMMNTLREIGVIFIPATICIFIFRKFDGRYNYAEIKDIKFDVKEEKEGEKHDVATCSNCGKSTKVSKERLSGFFPKRDFNFCGNCGIFLREGPLISIFSGVAEMLMSTVFIIPFFIGEWTTTKRLVALFIALGIIDGGRKIFSGVKGIMISKKYE